MSILALIFLVVLCVIATYYGKQLPAPWPMVIIAVIVIICLAAIFNMFGWLGSPLFPVR